MTASSEKEKSKKRRLPRAVVSLRVYLLLVSIIGVTAGVGIGTVQPMLRQWEAADELSALGASIETEPSSMLSVIKYFFDPARSHNITGVNFSFSQIKIDDILASLEKLPHLRLLTLNNCGGIDEKDFSQLKSLRGIEELSLKGCYLPDACANDMLAMKKLKKVDLSNVHPMTWRTLRTLRDKPDIEVIHNFEFDSANHDELVDLASFNNQTTSLSIAKSAQDSVDRAVQLFPNIRSITLEHWSYLDSDSFKRMSAIASRRELRIDLTESPTSIDPSKWQAVMDGLRPTKIQIAGPSSWSRTGNPATEIYQVHLSVVEQDVVQLKVTFPLMGNPLSMPPASPDFLARITQLDIAHCPNLKNLDALGGGAPNLRFVNVNFCEKLSSIEGLKNAPSVEQISLKNCQSFKRLAGWEDADQLRVLHLKNCKNLESLDELGQFKNLAELRLDRSLAIRSLAGLQGLDQLRSLTIVDCNALPDFSSLPSLPRLNSLSVFYSSELRNLDGLPLLPELKKINVAMCPELEQIDGLKNAPNLELVLCHSSRKLQNINGLRGLKKISQLSFDYCDQLADVSGLSGMDSLQQLQFKHCRSLSGFNGVENLKSLKSISIHHCPKLADFSQLHDSGLKELIFVGDSRAPFSDFRFLEPFRNLKTVTLQDFPLLESIDGIDGCPSLGSLFLHGCPKLTQLDSIQQASHLQSLSIAECPIQKLDFANMQGLKNLHIGNCILLEEVDRSEHLVGLKSLTLNHLPKLDPAWILNLPNLNELHIDSCRFSDDQLLANMAQLKKLLIRRCSQLPSISGFDLVEDLEVSQCPQLKALSGFKSVRRLVLDDCPAVSDIGALGEAASLEHFSLVSCPAIEDIEAIRNMQHLHHLKLHRNDQLRSIDVLRSLPQLADLTVNKCDTFKDLPSVLSDLSDLNHLSLSRSDLSDLQSLSNMKSLRVLELPESLWLKSLDGIETLSELRKLKINDSPMISNFEALESLPNLEEFEADGVDNHLLPDRWRN